MNKSKLDCSFPGESAEYRAARDALKEAELELSARLQEVAAIRAALPEGGRLTKEYFFDTLPASSSPLETIMQVSLSDMFRDQCEDVFLYNFPYAPGMSQPDTDSLPLFDALEAVATMFAPRVTVGVVAKIGVEHVRDWADRRGWKHLRLLSALNNSFNADYHAETEDGSQRLTCNHFRCAKRVVYHVWSAEPDESLRAVDLLLPLMDHIG